MIGIGFGLFLERAGFGSARKLVAQFYLTDMAVFKVMFTAIVTAMLGVTYLSWIGFLDLSLVYSSPTYWLTADRGRPAPGSRASSSADTARAPRSCPWPPDASTASCTSRASPRAPSASPRPTRYIGGLLTMGDLGVRTLPGVFGVSWGIVAFAVVLMAVGGFAGATWVERWMAARDNMSASAE